MFVWEHTVAQLVEALRYKPKDRGFEFPIVSLEFFFDIILPAALYFLGGKADQCVELTTLPVPCADCHEIWEPQLPVTLRACPGFYRDCFTLPLHLHMFIE